MAEYYIAPKSSFDATADAIREKTGSQTTIEWTEDGFADAIAAIPTGGGGGWSVDDIASGGITGSITVETSGANVVACAFAYNTGITEVIMPDATQLKGGVFAGCTGLTRLWIPSVSLIDQGSIRNFQDITCPLVLLGIPELSSRRIEGWKGTVLDIGSQCDNLAGTSLYGVSNCNVIILRKSSIVTCANSTFNSSKFASGGAGGTIYIPKSLYDHLGDNTSSDYKAATNWSTVNEYGTITWAQIEGSQYENYYADGTPISISE